MEQLLQAKIRGISRRFKIFLQEKAVIIWTIVSKIVKDMKIPSGGAVEKFIQGTNKEIIWRWTIAANTISKKMAALHDYTQNQPELRPSENVD